MANSAENVNVSPGLPPSLFYLNRMSFVFPNLASPAMSCKWSLLPRRQIKPSPPRIAHLRGEKNISRWPGIEVLGVKWCRPNGANGRTMFVGDALVRVCCLKARAQYNGGILEKR